MPRKPTLTGLAGLLRHDSVRRLRDPDDTWHYSILDVLALLADTDHPREHWAGLKRAEPHLTRLTDTLEYQHPTGEIEPLETITLGGLLRLAQSVHSPRAERIRQWLATTGTQRLQESADPELALLRVRRDYTRRGHDRRWIDKRLRGISARQELTSEWARRGVTDSDQYRALTNRLTHAAFGMDVESYRRSKHLTGTSENLRDHMTDLELLLTALGESAATTLHRQHGSQGFDELLADVEQAGQIAATTRAALQSPPPHPRASRPHAA